MRFLEQVDTVLAGFLGVLLHVQGDPGRIVLDVSRQDGLNPIHKKERGEAGGAVWRGAKALEHSLQFFYPAAG